MNDPSFTVYYHIFPDDKRYIGITSKPVQDRWLNGRGYRGQKVFYPITKYGWDNIQHLIYMTNLTEEEARIIEFNLIQEWNTLIPNGWNESNGGYYNNADIFNKEISQYDIEDNLIATFPSIQNAGYAIIGHPSTSICSACTHNHILAFGYQWRYGHKSKIEPLISDKRITYLIDQFTLDGKYIGTFKNASHAAWQFTHSPRAGNHILQVCRGERKIAYGYQWKFSIKDKQCDSVLEYKKEKEISAHDLQGKLIKTFKSGAEAAKYYAVDDGTIMTCCKGKTKTAYDKYWAFGHAPEISITKPKAGKHGGKTIYQYDKDTRKFLHEYKSLAEAARQVFNNVNYNKNISRTANGIGHTCGPYLWSYLKFDIAPDNLTELNKQFITMIKGE